MKVNVTNYLEIAREKGFDLTKFHLQFLADEMTLSQEEIEEFFSRIEKAPRKVGA